MNKTNLAKVFVAVLLIAVVAVATYNYGVEQRKKAASTNDPTKSALPTIQDENKKQAENNAKNDSKPDTAGVDTPSSPPVQAQVPTQNIPATGPADSLIPTIVLGGLTGIYLVGRRRLKNLS